MSRWTVEFLNASRLIRVLNSRKYVDTTLSDIRWAVLRPKRNADIIQALFPPIVEISVVVGIGALLVFGYLMGGPSAPNLVAELFVVSLVIIRLQPKVVKLNGLRLKFTKILTMVRLAEAKFHHGSITTNVEVGTTELIKDCSSIQFRKVYFDYPNGVSGLTNITFSLERGQILGIVGPTGAGKSTIADLLVGLYHPTDGKILIDNLDLSDMNIKRWRELVGFVDQNPTLLSNSIIENIGFGRLDVSFDEVEEAAHNAGAHQFIEKLPSGYYTEIGEKGHILSGGQQQRLALARALLRRPRVIILDEPTSRQDKETEEIIITMLERQKKNSLILVISHQLSTMRIADKVIYLEDGKIIEQDSFAGLIKAGGRFAKLRDQYF